MIDYGKEEEDEGDAKKDSSSSNSNGNGNGGEFHVTRDIGQHVWEGRFFRD